MITKLKYVGQKHSTLAAAVHGIKTETQNTSGAFNTDQIIFTPHSYGWSYHPLPFAITPIRASNYLRQLINIYGISSKIFADREKEARFVLSGVLGNNANTLTLGL